MAESNITTCNSCNATIKLNSKFCSKCGTNLSHGNDGAKNSSEENSDTYEIKTVEKDTQNDISKHELFKAIGIGLCIGLFLLLLIIMIMVMF